MPELKIEADAAEVGMDEARLRRLGTHFRRYVDDGRLPGWLMLVARQGKVVFLETYGQRDLEAGLPVELDTVFRIYSMTKPITTVAAMMLWEEGGFELKDPVHRFIPSFQDTRVWRTGSINNFTTDAQRDPIAVWNLMSHTSGLTYGFLHAHPIDELYRRAGFEWGVPPDADLAELCDTFASFPLLFQPGTEWNYSVATDVLGRVVEVVSGQSLDDFMRARIFEPLGMTDTGFWATDDKRDRLAALYAPNPADRKALRFDELGEVAHSRPSAWLGGGGLVSTAHDYYRFQHMLLNGGELDGVRLLSPRTLALMTQNHLPGGADLRAFGRPLFSETTFDGEGFGLGFSVTIDPVKAKVPGSIGDFAWGGAASTAFWVDPAEELTVQFLTQLLPSSTHPIRSQLKQLVHQAIVD